MYTVGSLFAGIGGFDLAFTAAGCRIAWQVENDAFCQRVLANHWPHTTRYGDIHDCHDLPYVDVITAGFPCQPFSGAGKSLGRDDDRYLVPNMMRVIQEVRPHVILLENVPRFATLSHGHEFRDLLWTFASFGYDAEWDHIWAKDVGAPHARKRWFCVAYANGARQRQSQGIVTNVQRRAHYRRQAMAHAAKQRLSQWQSPRQPARRAQARTGMVTRFERPGTRNTQSRLGRDFARLPARLDAHRWPAPPGSQYDWEPPRTVAPGTVADRPARLKVLGNAVVPQVVYPLAVAICEWLDAQPREQAA